MRAPSNIINHQTEVSATLGNIRLNFGERSAIVVAINKGKINSANRFVSSGN